MLLEKLVRAFDDIDRIYVLLRPKKGLSIQQRLRNLLESRAFSFHTYRKSQLAKVVAVAGDIREAGLGISDADMQILRDNVSIVFHNAANIRFDALLA